jgi:hypothetical protein
MLLSAFFGVIDELQKQSLGSAQLESERTTDSQVIYQRLSQQAHAAPPSHGRAMLRSASRSTLA